MENISDNCFHPEQMVFAAASVRRVSTETTANFPPALWNRAGEMGTVSSPGTGGSCASASPATRARRATSPSATWDSV